MKKVMLLVIAVAAMGLVSCEKTSCKCKVKTNGTTVETTYNLADYEGATDCKGLEDQLKRIASLLDPDYSAKCR